MGAYGSYFGGGEEKKECWLFHEHKRAELHISVASPCIDIFSEMQGKLKLTH